MIPRKNRLPVALFPRNSGVVVRLPEATVKCAPNGVMHNRIGIIVAKAVDRRSVVRHAVKRQVARAMLAIPKRGIDILVITEKAMGKGDAAQRRVAADRIAQEVAGRTSR